MIRFEIKENIAMLNESGVKDFFDFYRDKGFEYALDDVGERYSTLEMLAELKPKYMKLDMQYVQGVELREDFQWLKQRDTNFFKVIYLGNQP